MQVCRRWYDIASPYFFAVLPVWHSHRQSLVRHCRAHPELAAYTKDLHFLDESCGDSGNQPHLLCNSRPFDVEVLASALPFLTNLTTLVIVGYNDKTYRSLPFRCMTRRHQNPVALQRLTLLACWNTGFILHGLLSLFSVDTLVLDPHWISQLSNYPKSLTRVNALFPPASLAVRQLVLHQPDTGEHFYNFFERVFAPGCLHGLSTGSWTLRDELIDIFARFLRSPAAQNLVSISIGDLEPHSLCAPPYAGAVAASVGTPSARSDILGAALACCTRLQYLRIGLVHSRCVEKDPLSYCGALSTSLLANLPRTLRALALHLWVLVFRGRCWRWASPVKSLAPLDRFLGNSDPLAAGRPGEGRTRFQHLQRVELHVHFWHTELTTRDPSEMHEREEVGLKRAAVTALPRLRAAGLLEEFSVDDVEGRRVYGCECLLLESCVDF